MESVAWALVAVVSVLSQTTFSSSASPVLRVAPRAALYDERLSNSLRVNVYHTPGLGNLRSSAVVSFEPPGNCLVGEKFNYTISLWMGGAEGPQLKGPFAVDSCVEGLSTTLTGLQKDVSYSISLTAYNEDTRVKSKKVKFYTSDVQTAVLIQGEKCFEVHCTFAQGFQAKGCHVEVQLFDSYTLTPVNKKIFNIPVEQGYTCFELHPFTVPKTASVNDWELDNSFGGVPLTPQLVKGPPDMSCRVGTRRRFAATARIVLFYASAVLFVAGTVTIFIGIMCKICRLHSHFRKSESYKALQEESQSK